MQSLPKHLQRVIDGFASLPGIGPRSAQRIGLYLLNAPASKASQIAEDLTDLHKFVRHCVRCFNFTEEELCSVCADPRRNQFEILVVENPLEILAYEEAGYNGVYHSLGGIISPLQGIGPEKLKISELLSRLSKLVESTQEPIEVIIGCSTSLEGQATAEFVRRQILASNKLAEVKVTLPARGLPANVNIEYMDPNTLKYSLENRN